MKSILNFLLFTILLPLSAISQSNYEVIETPKNLIEDWQNSYTIILPGIDKYVVADAWDQIMKNAGARKLVTERNLMAFKQVNLPQISDQELEVYYKMYEDADAMETHFMIWFKQGDKFISSRLMPEASRAISKMLINFSFELEEKY